MVVDSATFPFPFLVAARASAQPDSFFGVEGGHAVLVGKDVYVVLTEFTAPPLWVPSKIALWRGSLLPPSSSRAAIRCCSSWRRIRTLFTSGGKTDCKSTRASLGSSAALAYDSDEGSWNVFYVGFVSCNDTSFVNRRGRIFRAVATVAGPTAAGIESSYVDADIAIEPNSTGAQRWEGTQGTDSFQPYLLRDGRGWASFYGSAGVAHDGTNHGQKVGLAFAPRLSGPWVRASGSKGGVAVNPVNLSAAVTHIEQPVVTPLSDGSYAAVFDALTCEGQGMVGYAWSPDGVTWKPEWSQLLNVSSAPWMTTGIARTPQGLVELPHNNHADLDAVIGSNTAYGSNKTRVGRGRGQGGLQLLLFFSGYDQKLPPHPSLPSMNPKSAADSYHESMGLALFKLGESTSGTYAYIGSSAP